MSCEGLHCASNEEAEQLFYNRCCVHHKAGVQMASQELKGFLGGIKDSYVKYAEQLHTASFESVTELAAATPEQLVQHANVPIGPAGAIVKAAAAAAAAATPAGGAPAAAGAAAAEEFAEAALTVQRRLPCATKYASYMCSGSGVKQAAVVVGRHHVATYHHEDHAHWDKGLEVQVSVNDADADQPRCIKGTVEYVDRQADLILLKVAEELAAPVLDAQLSPGQRYFVLGQSGQAQGDASSVSHGIIAATQPDVCSHVRGDMVAGVGDSGAGCFAVQTGRLIGMIVGTDPVAHKSVLMPGAVIAHALSLATPVA